MKLSQFSTDKAIDVLCELVNPISSIASDEELLDELSKALDFKKANTLFEKITLIVGKFTKLVPILMKKHKQDVVEILAIINETDVEKVGKQNILVTMAQIKELTKDKELLDFFKSCADSVGNE